MLCQEHTERCQMNIHHSVGRYPRAYRRLTRKSVLGLLRTPVVISLRSGRLSFQRVISVSTNHFQPAQQIPVSCIGVFKEYFTVSLSNRNIDQIVVQSRPRKEDRVTDSGGIARISAHITGYIIQVHVYRHARIPEHRLLCGDSWPSSPHPAPPALPGCFPYQARITVGLCSP